MAAESQKKQIYEVTLSNALEQLNISMDQFIDFCILSGCDYCDTLKGIGPATAIRLLVQHGCLEEVLKTLDEDKIPKNFNYQVAREFFHKCEAVNTEDITFDFKEPDFEGLSKFLVEENSFNKDRVDRYIERLKAAKSKTKQRPLDSFFGKPKVVINEADKFDPTKRKAKAKAGDKRGSVSSGPPAKRARR